MRPLVKHDLEVEVLGLHLTIPRVVGLAVLVCLLVLVAYTVSGLGGDDGEAPPIDNTTNRYEERETDWPLCTVFIFLAIVLVAVLVIEVGA